MATIENYIDRPQLEAMIAQATSDLSILENFVDQYKPEIDSVTEDQFGAEGVAVHGTIAKGAESISFNYNVSGEPQMKIVYSSTFEKEFEGTMAYAIADLKSFLSGGKPAPPPIDDMASVIERMDESNLEQ